MAQVNPGSLTDWQNGQTVTAEAYKQERQIIYTAINTNDTTLLSTTAGNSGADYVKSAPITGVTGTSVYAQLANIASQISQAVLGQIPDGSLTDVKLSNAAGNIKQTALLKAGGTMTGALTLSGAPSGANDATTKTYVDTADGNRVLKAGDTMTGLLTLSGQPTNNNHAATKLYVDRASVGSEVYAYRNFGGAL